MSEIYHIGGMPKYNAQRVEFQTLVTLKDITDVEWFRNAVEKLWKLLDDVDTADDMAKWDDKVYRTLAQSAMKKTV